MLTSVRIIFALLLQKQVFSELANGLLTLNFLKRMRGDRKLKGRFIAIFIASLHVITPILASIVNTIALS